MADFTHLRIGLTMRSANAADYHEPRDGLALDWAEFMPEALPGAAWMPIPNIGERVLGLAAAFALNGFIFTGGDDLDAYPLRDATETALLAHALDQGLPVFGVCRGLQMLNHHFGGGLGECPEGHVAASHAVEVSDRIPGSGAGTREVNSYHCHGIPGTALAAPLQAFAATADGWVEGAGIPDRPVAAVMWHPERGRPFRRADIELVRAVFGPGQKA